MVTMLVDLPYHKKWLLPDGVHTYNSVLYGNTFRITISNSITNEIVLAHSIDIDAEGTYKDLLQLAQELANKRFRKELRYVRKG